MTGLAIAWASSRERPKGSAAAAIQRHMGFRDERSRVGLIACETNALADPKFVSPALRAMVARCHPQRSAALVSGRLAMARIAKSTRLTVSSLTNDGERERPVVRDPRGLK